MNHGHHDHGHHDHEHHDHEHHDHEHHEHGHHDHGHGHHDHGHGHAGHTHPSGIRGVLHGFFVPHSHDASDSIDDALEANTEGIRALKISLIILLITTVLQAMVVAVSGSVALLADTIHNFSDALTAVPLWIAFALSRRAATRRYTYGFNRAEDLAGLFIITMIALSAIIAAWEAIQRILHPQPMSNLGWVIVAGVIGFLGNEIVAVYRIRVGRKIGSAALVADGVHARTDGLTSLAVVAGGIGVIAGFPLADPIVGLLIAALIFILLIGTVRSVARRLMDGIEPELIGQVEHALSHVPEIAEVEHVRLRWVGHRLHGDVAICVGDRQLAEANQIAQHARESIKHHLPKVDDMTVTTIVGRNP